MSKIGRPRIRRKTKMERLRRFLKKDNGFILAELIFDVDSEVLHENIGLEKGRYKNRKAIAETDRRLFYLNLAKLQGNFCAICGIEPQAGKRLLVDHCHSTGRTRGLLCAKCNVGLGYYLDSVHLLYNAILYLKTPPTEAQYADLWSDVNKILWVSKSASDGVRYMAQFD